MAERGARRGTAVLAFDVFTADHADVKAGRLPGRRSRVLLAHDPAHGYGWHADLAAALAVARHGGMAVAVLVRH